jgi:hypothetical protein
MEAASSAAGDASVADTEAGSWRGPLAGGRG